MPSRATAIADALRPKKAPDAPDVFSAPKQSWAEYSGYEGMPAPQAEGMPTHDPDGTVSRIANALATLPTVQSIKEQVMLPRQILSGEKGVPQSFGPTTPDAQTDEAIGFGLGNAVRPGAAMSIAKMPLAPGEAVLGAGPIRAYHGSPHDFDKFDLSKIGTGEGAQAYGHGLYFAEKEGTAKSYRESLAGPPKGLTAKLDGSEQWYEGVAPRDQAGMGELWARISPYKINTPEDAARILARAKGDLEKTLVNVEGGHIKVRPGEADSYREALRLLNEGRVTFDPPHTPGRMYEVAIHADPERFLDWDKPLSGQSEHVAKAVEPLSVTGERALSYGEGKKQFLDPMRQLVAGTEAGRFVKPEDFFIGNVNMDAVRGAVTPEKFQQIEALQAAYRSRAELRGSDVYNTLAGTYQDRIGGGVAAGGKSPDVANQLREAGIPGIKYLDQGSRKGPTGITSQDIAERILDAVGGNHAKAVAEAESRLSTATMPTPELNEALGLLKSGWKPDRTSNYVLFDDKIVEILRKYGVGSIAALPPAVQMAIQLHQDQTQAEPQESTFAGKASKMINDLQRKLRGPEPPATPLGMGIRG